MDPDFRRVSPSPKSVKVAPGIPNTETAPAPKFQTPDQAAAADDVPTTASGEHLPVAPPPDQQAKGFGGKSGKLATLKASFHDHKREWLISTAIVLVCGVIVGGILIKINKHPVVAAQKPVVKVVKAPPKPTTVPSTLTGLPVAPAINQLPVTGVMVENSLQARPQSGLSNAGVVFEAIAEGGITRFLTLFQDTQPANVGPIRSARPYYEQWALGFDAGYAHVGGSPEALADLKAWGVRDLDQFYNSGSYHRISSRAAPHNVYTAITTLQQLEAGKGYNTSTYTGFIRKPAEAPAKQPTAAKINLAVSGPDYNVHYDYNPATNSYNRSEGGAPHIDANTNTQISPKVAIAMVMPYSLEADGYHSDYGVIGSGKAYVFQDGTVVIGQWNKPDAKTQLTFTDPQGNPIKLNPGQTWLTAVRADNNVTYTP